MDVLGKTFMLHPDTTLQILFPTMLDLSSGLLRGTMGTGSQQVKGETAHTWGNALTTLKNVRWNGAERGGVHQQLSSRTWSWNGFELQTTCSPGLPQGPTGSHVLDNVKLKLQIAVSSDTHFWTSNTLGWAGKSLGSQDEKAVQFVMDTLFPLPESLVLPVFFSHKDVCKRLVSLVHTFFWKNPSASSYLFVLSCLWLWTREFPQKLAFCLILSD